VSLGYFGFRTTNEYYNAISPVRKLLDINIPTLFLIAKDDPICSHKAYPIDDFIYN